MQITSNREADMALILYTYTHCLTTLQHHGQWRTSTPHLWHTWSRSCFKNCSQNQVKAAAQLKRATTQRTLKMTKIYKSIVQSLFVNRALIPIPGVTQGTPGSHSTSHLSSSISGMSWGDPGQQSREMLGCSRAVSSLPAPSQKAVAKRQKCHGMSAESSSPAPVTVPQLCPQTQHPTGHSVSPGAFDNLPFVCKAALVEEFREPYDSKNCW